MSATRTCLSFAALLLAASMIVPAAAGELRLALANSTCDAMSQVENAYRETRAVRFSHLCKSSGLLAKGLRGGALKADIFVSADREWMDFAVENGLVAAGQAFSPWANALVVATPASSPMQRLDWTDLASDQVTVILIGDPSTAPFGRHAKEALEASGLWDQVKHKIQTRKNIELLAESLAASSPGTVGILFKTHVGNRLRQLHVVRKELHTPIRYYVAPLKTAANDAEVAAFLRFVQGKAAKDIFEAEGFDVSAP